MTDEQTHNEALSDVERQNILLESIISPLGMVLDRFVIDQMRTAVRETLDDVA